jgi:large subunit ribosomal protein L28
MVGVFGVPYRCAHFGELAMECPVTGIKTRFGNRVSHANNKTRRTWEPNMQSKRIWVPNENRFVRLRLSAQGIKMIDKIGIEAVLIDMRKRGIKP